MNMLHHRGYSGSSEWSSEDNVFFGKILDIGDLVMYEADTETSLVDEFQAAVDEYIYFKEALDL